ncbi:MAG: hypothetical protein ACRD2A_02020, partial [Vicinamibacterales bacterium]
GTCTTRSAMPGRSSSTSDRTGSRGERRRHLRHDRRTRVMPEQTWNQTFCNLCYVNCGLEVATEGRRITRVRAVAAAHASAA